MTSAPNREGVCQMRTLLLIFACERPKYADTVRSQKTVNIFGRPLWLALKSKLKIKIQSCTERYNKSNEQASQK